MIKRRYEYSKTKKAEQFFERIFYKYLSTIV
jgi:hypothetical protein